MNQQAKLNIFQGVGLLVAQMLDLTSTIIGLHAGASEANGLVAWIIRGYGFAGFLTLKLVAGLLLIMLTWGKPVQAWVMTLVFAGLALYNMNIIIHMLGGYNAIG